MLVINAQLDARALLANMKRREKRTAYAVAAGINDTAKDAQKDMQALAGREYEVRKPSFVLRQVAIIKPFASPRQGRPFAIISVGQKDRLLLATLERGGTRNPVKGKRVAVPITGGPARPTFSSPVPKQWQFGQLKLRPIKPAKNGPNLPTFITRQGLLETFILDGPLVSQPGVYRRTGPNRGDIEIVYAFEEPMALKPSLNFVRTVTTTIHRRLKENFERQIKKEITRGGRT